MNIINVFRKPLFFSVIVFLMIPAVYGQFKTDRQKELESILMAPCCGGGTLAEHDDNQHTLNMKMIINALTDDKYDEAKILELFKTTYQNEGIYRLGFSPATKPVNQILSHVKRTIHPGMTLAEIVDLFAWIHTPAIRSTPPERGIHQLAWKMPAILLILGTIIIILIIRNSISRPDPVHKSGANKGSDAELENRIEKEMKELKI